MTTYKPLVLIAGLDQQLDSSDALEVSTIDIATLNLTGNLTVTGDLTCCDATVNTVNNPNYIQFNTSYTDGFAEGRLQWNSNDGTLEVGMPGGNVNLQIGQEQITRVCNVTGNTINNATLVTMNGAQGNRPKIEVFDPNVSDKLCGITTESIDHNDFGYVTLGGLVRDVDTSSWNEGDRLWADYANPGGYTNVEPTPPQHKWCIGIVLVSDASNGTIYFKTDVIHELAESADVSINTANLTGGEAIIWDATNEYWINTGTPDAFPQYSHLKTGWDEDVFNSEVTVTVNATTRTVSIAPTGNEISYWIAGAKYTINSTQNVTWNDTEGSWFIYFTANGLTASQTPWDFDDTKAYCVALYWDAADQEVITWSPEFHSWVWPDKLNEYLHESFGTRWVSGLDVTVNTSNITVDVANGEIYDEDIECHIYNTGGTGPWVQQLQDLSAPIDYRLGVSDWRKTATSNTPTYLVSNIPQVNTYNGTEWVLTNVGVNKYFCTWVVASTAGDGHPVYFLMGQADGGTLAEAEEANTVYDLQLNNVASAEHKVLARIMLKRVSSPPYYEIEHIDDYRDVADEPAGGGSTTPVSDHGGLTGLSDDDHTQYVLVDGTRDMTGNLTVNANISATGDITVNRVYTSSAIVGGGAISGASLSVPLITSATGTINCNNDDIATTGNLTANALSINTITSTTGNVNCGTNNVINVGTYYGSSVNVTGSVNGTTIVASILLQTPSVTSASGTVNFADDHIVTTGNITSNVANIITANLDGYLEGYAGSPSNNDVLTWVTANSRAEFAAPTGGSGSAGASITSNTTYYLDPTGNDTTGDGTANSPWLTINKVYESLADEVIADDVEVTIQLANGTYNYTSTVVVHHPQSSRITVKGGDTYDITMNTFVSLSGTQPHRSMVLTVSDTANCSVGDTVIIRDTAVATRNVLLRGATQITSINSSNSTITCNLWKGWTTYDPSTGALTANLTVLKTNVSFNGCDSFLVQDGGHLKIQDIGFDGVDLNYSCLQARGTGRIETTSNNVAGYRFANGVAATYGGNVECEYSAWSYCNKGIYAGYGGQVHANNTLINGCSLTNFNVIQGAYLDCSSSHSCGCAGDGLQSTGGFVYGDTLRCYGNANNGTTIQKGGAAFLNACTLAWSGARGLLCQYGAYAELANCNVVANNSTGVFYYGQCGGRVVNGAVQYNGDGGVYVGNNSCCQTYGATISLNTSWQTSPSALDTLGNNFSFIYT